MIRFQTFEDLLVVVQDDGYRIESQVVIRFYARAVPPSLGGIVHQEHVVGKYLAKAKIGVCGSRA